MFVSLSLALVFVTVRVRRPENGGVICPKVVLNFAGS
jgi:hypothetical protein